MSKSETTWQINSDNQAEYKSLFDFIINLAKNQTESLIIFLNGNLGAGKTTFTKLFINYLNQNQNQNQKPLIINSPTFGKIHEYKIQNKNFYHLDLYREIPSAEELEEIFLDLNSNYICLEWANKLTQKSEYNYLISGLAKRIINLNFTIVSAEKRLITLQV